MYVTPRRLPRRAEEGRRARDHGHLRQRAGLVVRVDGDHGVVVRPTATDGDDPFATPVDVKGVLTHGHLAENDNHGGAPNPKDYTDLTKLPSAKAPATVPIENFVYARGDMSVADSVPDREARRHDHLRQQHRRAARERHLAHDHLVQGAVQRVDRHRLPAGRRRPGVRLRRARRKAGPPTAGRLTWSTPVGPARTAPTPTSAGSTRSCGARSGSTGSPTPMAGRARTFVLAALVVVLAAGGALWWFFLRDDAPEEATLDSSDCAVQRRSRPRRTGRGRCEPGTVEEGFVGYRIEELFGGRDHQEDRGRAHAGRHRFDDRGRLDRSATSRSTADLTTLASDRTARDTKMTTDGLETDDFPEASFTTSRTRRRCPPPPAKGRAREGDRAR